MAHEIIGTFKFNKPRAAAAGFLLALTGCTAPSMENPSPTPTIEASPTATSTLSPVEQMIEQTGFKDKPAPCPSEGSAMRFPEFTERKANDCLDFYNGGRIVMVNYSDISQKEADRIALDTEQMLEQSTGGIINVDITAVPASDAARELFALQNPYGCSDIRDIHTWPSYIAEVAGMVELQEADRIIGLSDQEKCELGAGGVADSRIPNRHAEAFYVGPQVAEARKNGGEYVIEEVSDNVIRQRYLSNPAVITVHEALHTITALGHSGDLVHPDGSLTTSYQDMLDGEPLDLIQYVSESDYYEYGYFSGDNPMGGGATREFNNVRLDAAQIGMISWPSRVLGEETTVRKIDIAGSEDIVLDYTSDNTIAILNLDTPLPVSESVQNAAMSKYEEFSQVVVTPVFHEGFSKISHVDIQLVGDYNSVIDIGKMQAWSEESRALELRIDDSVIKIRIIDDQSQVVISYVPAA